jgi:membrane-bound serine protease (ClpP class)
VICIIAGVLLFEFLEHVVLPIAWVLLKRRSRPLCGPESMVGQVVEVKEWRDGQGKVVINGELWKAESDVSMAKGMEAAIEGVHGLVLKVKPIVHPGDSAVTEGEGQEIELPPRMSPKSER